MALWRHRIDGLRRGARDDALYVSSAVGPQKIALAQHVIDMREGFAEGEAHLVRIERAVEKNRHEFRRRARFARTCFRYGLAALFVMGDERGRAFVQAVERQLMAGQDERVLGQILERMQRANVEAERIAVGCTPEGSEVVAYLNRLSDLIWTMARWAEGDEHELAKEARA